MEKKIHAPKLVSIIVPRIFQMTCASRGDLRDSSSRAHWAKNSKFVQKPQIVAIGKKFDIFKNFDQYACLLKCQKLKFLIFLKKDAQCVSWRSGEQHQTYLLRGKRDFENRIQLLMDQVRSTYNNNTTLDFYRVHFDLLKCIQLPLPRPICCKARMEIR